METTIKIECDNKDELLTHLYVIADQIQKTKKFKEGFVEKELQLSDDNCYGSHEVIIKP